MLFFDGDLRRIYEASGTFTVDGDGYRVYSGDGTPRNEISVADLWSRWVDYHNVNKWALLAFQKSGGAFRYTDSNNVDVFATYDLRLINGWEIVPANYPHKFVITGNLFGDATTGADFDTSRLTSFGVASQINQADSLQTAVVTGGVSAATLNEILAKVTLNQNILEGDIHPDAASFRILNKDTKEQLVGKDVEIIDGRAHLTEPIP